jgi:membrane protein DedA with SNARE-associated domain
MNHLIITYGYLAVALLVGAESIGIPLPGETSLILAAVYAGHTHQLSVWIIFAVAAAAAIAGDNIGFWIGGKGGYRLLRKYGHYVRIDESKLKIGRYIFDRHGGKVVFLGRFVSVLRTYAALLAGINRMRWPRFLLYNAAGGVLWAAVYSFVAYNAGSAFSKASGPINLALGAAATVAIVATLFVVRRQAARLAQRAEAAYPGPLGQPGPSPAHPGASAGAQEAPSATDDVPWPGDDGPWSVGDDALATTACQGRSRTMPDSG